MTTKQLLGAIVGFLFCLVSAVLFVEAARPEPWPFEHARARDILIPASGTGAGDELLTLPAPGEEPAVSPTHAPASKSPAPTSAGEPSLDARVAELLRENAALVALGEPAEDFEEPTADALYALTVARFTDESFRNLTSERAIALLPVDEADADLMRFPGTLDEVLVGGLPTRADVDLAFERSPTVRTLLEGVQGLDLLLAELDMIPLAERSPGSQRARQVETVHLVRDELATQLMLELERVTGYPHWSLLYRLRQAWARAPGIPEGRVDRSGASTTSEG